MNAFLTSFFYGIYLLLIERYNPWADQRSWESAGFFILEAFGLLEYESAKPEQVSVTTIDYVDETDGNELQSYLAMPNDSWQRPLPAVVIFPDWDGVNLYEQERATALADLGYVALAADIYGKDLHEVPDINDRIEQVTLYRSNPDLYLSRMQKAIDQVKALDDVDSDEIAIIGYCFGMYFLFWYLSFCLFFPLIELTCLFFKHIFGIFLCCASIGGR